MEKEVMRISNEFGHRLAKDVLLSQVQAELKVSALNEFWHDLENYRWLSSRNQEHWRDPRISPADFSQLRFIIQRLSELVEAASSKLRYGDGQGSKEPISTGVSRHRLLSWLAGCILAREQPDLPSILRGMYFEALHTLRNRALKEAMRERDTDDYLAEFLVFGEPNDAMMDISVASLPGWETVGEDLGQISALLRHMGMAAQVKWALSSAAVAHLREHGDHAATRDRSTCIASMDDVLEAGCLIALQQYTRVLVTSFVLDALSARGPVLGRTAGGDAFSIDEWSDRFSLFVYDELLTVRIGKLFDIIRDMPHTMPAIEDILLCLTNTRRYDDVASALRAQLQQRLLVPGADTPTIIEQYIGLIKAMRVLDPSGALIESAGAPVRQYLRTSRPDTIRCLVSMLTGEVSEGEGLDSLQEELTRPVKDESDGEDADNDAAVLESAETWCPPSVEARSETRDMVTFLVGIYGNRDQFLLEYRSLLAARVLSSPGFEIERDIRTLELLKLRFEGERTMAQCEVMLKDVGDSKRLAAAMQGVERAQGMAQDEWFSSLVISHLYWPSVSKEDIAVPAPVDGAMTRYAQKYSTLKMPRKVKWMKHLGSVTLELVVDGTSKEFEVTPPQAAVVWHFQEKESWPAEALAQACGMPEPSLRKRAAFWMGHGVLTEQFVDGKVVYSRVDSLSQAAGTWGSKDEDADMAVESAQNAMAEKMAMHEQYILGMLTNFDEGLPVSRIHNMLKMFVLDGSYDATEAELSAFIERLAADDKVVYEAGIVSRPRS